MGSKHRAGGSSPARLDEAEDDTARVQSEGAVVVVNDWVAIPPRKACLRALGVSPA